VTSLRVGSSVYWTSVTEGLYLQDAWQGLIKPFALGFVMAGLRRDKRALHDLIAGTRVERLSVSEPAAPLPVETPPGPTAASVV